MRNGSLRLLSAFFLCSLTASGAQAAPNMLHVSGNQLVSSTGSVVRLRGINISGLDTGYGQPNDPNNPTSVQACNPNQSILDSVNAALSDWHVNFIRLPLSQDLWWNAMGDNGGSAYRATVDAIVALVAANNAYIELEIHSTDAGTWGKNVGRHDMPDGNTQTVVADIARRYANNAAVLFGVFSEPNAQDWDTWRNGGVIEEAGGVRYNTPGMQPLVDAARRSGARNVVVVGGLEYGYDLSGVHNGYALLDNNIAYDAHVFPWKGPQTDWDAKVTVVADRFPVLVGEFGVSADGLASWDSTQSYLDALHAWLQTNGFSYAAWNLNADPYNGPNLVSDWCFTPTPDYGAVVKPWFVE